MYKKILNYVVLSMLTVFLYSCGSPKNVAYIQNSEETDYSTSEFLYDAKIMPKDILTITVNTVNPEASAPFNLVVSTELSSKSATEVRAHFRPTLSITRGASSSPWSAR